MPVSFKYNAWFIHIPKTGGKSISAMLGLQQHDLSVWYGRKDGLVLTHLTLDQLRERVDVDKYYKFAFVRDPYKRIVSEYNWRMRNRAAFEEPTGKYMSFVAYCELLLDKWDKIMANPNITERQHVTEQYKYVDDTVDIYRHEDFVNECKRLQKRLGMNTPVPHVNGAQYATQHTDRTIQITNIIYEKDFETFGYKMK
jgi:hypothetical protein